MPKFKICMIPVRRIATAHKYNPCSYEIALLKSTPPANSNNTFHFLSYESQNGPSDTQTVKELLMEQYQINGLTVHPLSSCYSDNVVTIMYIVPIEVTSEAINLSSNIEFINFEDLLEEPGQIHNNRDFLLAVDEWLSERYYISTVHQNQLFSSDVSEVGVVQEIVTNPLRGVPVPPKEECLVLSFNNPAFPVPPNKT